MQVSRSHIAFTQALPCSRLRGTGRDRALQRPAATVLSQVPEQLAHGLEVGCIDYESSVLVRASKAGLRKLGQME